MDRRYLEGLFSCPRISPACKLSLEWMFLVRRCIPGVFVSFYTYQWSSYSRRTW
jgi:hypothetical protein